MNVSHIFRPVPPEDWLVILSLFLGIIALIGLAEAVRGYFQWRQEFSRKLVHIVVGLLTIFAPMLLHASLPLLIVAAFFTLVNFIATRKGLLKGMHGERKTYGTTFYPISFFVLVLFAWQDYKIVLIGAMVVLALGDAAAAIVGESLSRARKYVLITEEKSIEGSAAMFFVSAAALFVVIQFYPFNSQFATASPLTALCFALVTAAVATAAESLSAKGSDNLSVPLFSALILYFMISHTYAENVQLTLAVGISLVFALASYRAKFLDKSGAVAAFLLAVVIFGFGGWKWAIPILTFFILSSVLSRIGRIAKSSLEDVFEKGSQRDYAQALANGGAAGFIMILYMFFGNEQMYLLYLAALAAAMADTWATEIGTLSRQTPRLISNFKKVSVGTSGGITLAGTAGSILGALVLSLSGWAFIANPESTSILMLLVVMSGTLAGLLDSFLGATIQIQYRCPICKKITEKRYHCQDVPTQPLKGWKWMSNDVVNFINTLSAVALMGGALVLLA